MVSSFSPIQTSMKNLRITNSFLLNSMLHGVVTARSSLQNIVLLPKSWLKMIHHSPLLRLMPQSKRSLPKDSESKVSQHSSSSKTEKRPTIQEEEPLTLLYHGSSKNLDQHQLKLLVPLFQKRWKPTNSSLLSLVLNLRLFTLMLILPMLTLRTRLPLFILMMPLVPLNTEPLPQVLFSSENSRPPLCHTQVLLTKNHLLTSLSH